MFYVEIILVVTFIGTVFFLAQTVVMQMEQKADEDVLRARESYQRMMDQKAEVDAEKNRLEYKAAQIFMLYEMTQEINRHFNEEEAFAVFQRRLKENITFEDCRMVQTLPVNDASLLGYDSFPLKGQDKDLGILLFKGVPERDEEKFTILARQFALALLRITLYREIEMTAITDALTGVYTRRYFMERLQEELRRSQVRKAVMSVLLIDADHFKKVNDKHGHQAGDEVLRQVAGMVKENVREIDIAGRYGGEEFCVLLPDTDTKGAVAVSQRIRKSLEGKKLRVYDTALRVTVSIGTAAYPADGKTADELLDKADWALYRAKSSGRNCVIAFGEYNKHS